MFWFPFIIVIVTAFLLVFVDDYTPLWRAVLVTSLVLNTWSMVRHIPILPSYPALSQVQKSIRACEKELPRNLHCRIEIVKP